MADHDWLRAIQFHFPDFVKIQKKKYTKLTTVSSWQTNDLFAPTSRRGGVSSPKRASSSMRVLEDASQ